MEMQVLKKERMKMSMKMPVVEIMASWRRWRGEMSMKKMIAKINKVSIGGDCEDENEVNDEDNG